MIDLGEAGLPDLLVALREFCQEWQAVAVSVTYELPDGILHVTVRSDGSAWMTNNQGTVRCSVP